MPINGVEMRFAGHSRLRIVWLALLGNAFGATFPPSALGITINIEYSTDFGGDESPSWDPNGAILQAQFQAAKQIWESLLPGEGEITFDFQWDDDLGSTTFGQYTPGFDEYIEINPLWNWFADPTPNDSSEFAAPLQTLYSQITPEQLKSSHFPATTPPDALEVGYRGSGKAIGTLVDGVALNTVSATGQIIPASGGNPAQLVDASNGFDLLSTVVHEIGHALGLSGIEPGNYNILPEHLGGLEDVEVLEGGGGHLAGQGNVPYLMCESCGEVGVRRFPTATDILVIAEELGVSNVHLSRVGRILAGSWSDANAWIGADVPNVTQNAYVRSAVAVTMDANASVKSLVVDGGGSVDATGFQLVSSGDIRFDGGAITAGAGAVVRADAIHGNPATLTTTAGSTIEFNSFTRGASSATAATFNGNVNIGVGASADAAVNFDPDTTIAAWTVGQDLKIGGSRSAKLVIDNGLWTVGGNLEILRSLETSGEVVVDGGFLDTAFNLTGGSLDVTGTVTIGGALTYRGRRASNTTYTLNGGVAYIKHVPPTPPFLASTGAGQLTFEDTTQGIPVGASVDTATINVGGGTGDGASGGNVFFKGSSVAVDAEFWNMAGIGGVSLRISNPIVIAGTGGRVIFEDTSNANTSHFRNDGGAAHGPHGSGGATYFLNSSSASNGTFDNYGSTLQSYSGAVPAPGGRTEFFDTSRASFGTFNNHPGQGMGSLGAGVTIFRGSSSAANGTFNNEGGVPGAQHGGSTEFYDNTTADDAVFYNQHAQGVTQHAGSAGNVRFYGSSTAENATFYNQVGGGTVYFNDSSTAGDAHFFIEDTGTGTFGGHVVFNGNSKGGTADLTIRESAFSATVEFRGTSNAEQAEITLVNGSQANIWVYNSSSLGHANLDIGSSSSMVFRDSATAANSMIRLRSGSSATFNNSATAANATFNVDGATVSNGGTGGLYFDGGTAGAATLNINAGSVPGAAGGQLRFGFNTSAGNATINAAAGVAGAGVGRVSLSASTDASNSRIMIGSGGSLELFGFGDAPIGSLDAAGSVFIGQTGLRVGGLNTSNTISGSIGGFLNNGNARIFKVGTGTLTLSGANTYYGLTTVEGGTLVINGTTPGAVEVNSGAVLGGTGSIGGAITVKSGGTLAPGASPGTLTMRNLTLATGSQLDFELGDAARDHIVLTNSGNVSLGGTLHVSLAGAFAPTLGQLYPLFEGSIGSISGAFQSIVAPTINGLTFNLVQNAASAMLEVVAAPPLAGDYNGDGLVDAADYTVWRDSLGSATNLVADGSGNGVVDQADHAIWAGNYGATGTSVATSPAVPEPAAALLALVAASVMGRRRIAR